MSKNVRYGYNYKEIAGQKVTTIVEFKGNRNDIK